MSDHSMAPPLPVEYVQDIPLYLIPRVIADQIRERGGTVLKIGVARTSNHYYNIRFEYAPGGGISHRQKGGGSESQLPAGTGNEDERREGDASWKVQSGRLSPC